MQLVFIHHAIYIDYCSPETEETGHRCPEFELKKGDWNGQAISTQRKQPQPLVVRLAIAEPCFLFLRVGVSGLQQLDE